MEFSAVRITDYLRRLWTWTKSNKLKAALLVFGLYCAYQVVSIPWFAVSSLAEENPVETALMRQRMKEAENRDEPLKIKHQWIPINKIPRHVINAVVVAEDGRFWEHDGFDWYEFEQSLKKNWEKKRAVRGASTITQQLAKNLYLSTSKDPIRKLKEWVITWLLEKNLEKRRILEIYLNVIEWGKGIFGIEAAARTYFGRAASALTYDQAVRLAAVIPSPLKHRPTDNTRWVTYRKNVVAARMAGRRYNEEEIEEDDNEPDQQQIEEKQSSQPLIDVPPDGAGHAPPDNPKDSVAIERGDSNDVQRREQAD